MSATAAAVPQLAGSGRPGGSVLYLCGGENERGARCGKLLMVWLPPAAPVDGGVVETKCKRCKTVNSIRLSPDERS